MVFYFVDDGDIRIDIDDYWTQATSAEADAYFLARGVSDWVATDTEKAQGLQRAWDYMRTLPWIEEVFGITQPNDIKNGHILLALEEVKDPGVLTPALTRDDYIQSKGIGSGAITKSYRPGAPAWKRFRGVDMLLGPYLQSAINIRLERG